MRTILCISGTSRPGNYTSKALAVVAEELARQGSEPTVLDARSVLEMATINGARALGIDEITGSLEAGKSADIVAVNFDTIETIPVYDPISHLVYCSSREHVTDVWIAGRQRLSDRVLNTIDENKLKQDCINICSKIEKYK